jgi:hypothetical protein
MFDCSKYLHSCPWTDVFSNVTAIFIVLLDNGKTNGSFIKRLLCITRKEVKKPGEFLERYIAKNTEMVCENLLQSHFVLYNSQTHLSST